MPITINHIRRKTNISCKVLAVSIVLLVSACSSRPFHPTMVDALTEFPGKLVGADLSTIKSVQVLRQQTIAGGVSLLYRWQTSASAANGTYCLAATFVTPERGGWRAQSTGFFDGDNQALKPACSFTNNNDFIAGYYPGGNVTDLTTVFGLSSQGSKVRILWSDGQISIAPIQNKAFLDARPKTLRVDRVDLLDVNNNVLKSKNL